ncbi:MAG: M1 family metallopeptidase [Bacteroidota bacterium]
MKRFSLLFFILIRLPVFAQHQDKVDFTEAYVTITPKPMEKALEGQVTYTFKVIQAVDSVFLDAKNMGFTSVRLNSRKVEYTNTGKKIIIHKKLTKNSVYNLRLSYKATPKQTVYFLGWDDTIEDNEQIWTQGQGKYTSHWLPSFDDMREKVIFDLNIQSNKAYKTIANGKLIGFTEIPVSDPVFSYDMHKPMSSYLLAFAIGKYGVVESRSRSGIPLLNYYYPWDSLKREPTYRYTKEILDFLEAEIDVPYPWQNYKQVPVHDFLYAGMENTGTTLFSDQYVIDSIAFVDKNYVNVNAHEMAHQWFGNLVTEENGEHHWLHEGFATYYAYLAEKHLFGDDHFHWKLFQSMEQLGEQSEKGEVQSLLDPKANSLTFYEKGAWALFSLREHIGEKAFKTGIRNYLKKYALKNVTVSEFLKEMQASSGKSLENFKKEWLLAKGFPMSRAKALLGKKSFSIATWLRLRERAKSTTPNPLDLNGYWEATSSMHFKRQLIQKYGKFFSKELFVKAFQSDTVPLRQTLLQVDHAQERFTQEQLESLLSDKSYITQEMAFYALWQRFPENRKVYLDQTRKIQGMPNKNIRLLWLTLALLTQDYEAVNSGTFYDELSGYTGAQHPFEIRQGAFFYVREVFGLDDKSLLNLIRATGHHAWRFREYARNLVEELWEDDTYKERMQQLIEKQNPEDMRYITKKLER